MFSHDKYAVAADGHGLRAMVGLQPTSFSSVGPLPPPSQQAATDNNSLCVQPVAGQGQTPNDFFVSTCEWSAVPYAVQLASGQALIGITLVTPQGVPLQVNVNDPGGLLPPAPIGPAVVRRREAASGTEASSGSAIDPQLQVFLRTPDHLVHRVPETARTAAGRKHSILIPVGMAMVLSVRSAQLTVLDSNGRAITADIPVPAATASAAPPAINITIQRGRP
jgi:hypothetical protein